MTQMDNPFSTTTEWKTTVKRRLLVMLMLLALGYLLAWPVAIEPQAWTPPPMPSLEQGPYARNDKLRAVQRIADGGVAGPEAIAIDAAGRLYSGLDDGRIVSMRNDGSDCRVLGNTGGRPLGLHVQADGALLIADAKRGLLRLRADLTLETVTTAVDGIGLGFADDLEIDARGRVLLSDASWKFGFGRHIDDALEHGGRGRLLLVDPATGDGAALMANLQFANGVALGPGEQFVLVNETTAYRVRRFWLAGDKAGSTDIFIDNLPGFPDNLSFNGRDRFWVALYEPRSAMLDALLPHPFLRRIAARLPRFMQPAPKPQSFVLGLDLDGKVVEQYQYAGSDAYGPVTSVREHEGVLYLGSLSDTAVGRVALRDLRRGGAGSAPAAALPGSCRP